MTHPATHLPALWKLAFALLIAYGVFMLGGYTWFVASHDKLFGGDYITFYTRAVALWHGAGGAYIYDLAAVQATLDMPFGAQQEPVLTFPYPPHFLLLLLPFGAVGYDASVALWLVLTGALYCYAIFTSSLWRSMVVAHRPYRAVLVALVLLSPFAVANIMPGQNGFLTAGLAILGLGRLRQNPLLAGLCFGILTIKPQLGVMIAVALLAGRHWKCIFTASLVALAMVAATTLWLGTGIWGEWLAYTDLFMQMQKHQPQIIATLNVSLYRALVGHGVPEMLAGVLQAGCFALAAWAVWRATRMPELPHALWMSIIITGAIISVPHVLAYDLTVLVIPVLYLIQLLFSGTADRTQKMALVALLVSVVLAYLFRGWPAAFAALLMAFVFLLRGWAWKKG
ncbi:MAG: glycosyltransferase family 87 protein [Alphaproteobacteria bacterium]